MKQIEDLNRRETSRINSEYDLKLKGMESSYESKMEQMKKGYETHIEKLKDKLDER
ncbi:MAG: hypothetical protein HQK51_15965 [Oligoflexia bacterium]|nr:hypothetical protein [Oligoflexia bacterium]